MPLKTIEDPPSFTTDEHWQRGYCFWVLTKAGLEPTEYFLSESWASPFAVDGCRSFWFPMERSDTTVIKLTPQAIYRFLPHGTSQYIGHNCPDFDLTGYRQALVSVAEGEGQCWVIKRGGKLLAWQESWMDDNGREYLSRPVEIVAQRIVYLGDPMGVRVA